MARERVGHRITYAIRERGEVSLYSSRWGALSSPQDVFWGPEETRAFIESNAETDRWYDDCWGEGGVALDLDTRTVAFFGVYSYSGELRALYLELMRELWGPAWTVRWVDDMPEIAAQVGVDPDLVRSPPIVEEPASVGSTGLRSACGLVTVTGDGAARDLVVDRRLEGLLMSGPALLEHLDKGTPWDEFLTRTDEWEPSDEYPLNQRIQAYLTVDHEARALTLTCVHARHDLGFLERLLRPRWPGWRVDLRRGGPADHFAALSRALPPALTGTQTAALYLEHAEDDEVPPTFQGRVAYIAKLVLGLEERKDETAAFAARVGQDLRAEADGPVHFAPGFFDRVPASGPKADAAARFREAAEAVWARRSS